MAKKKSTKKERLEEDVVVNVEDAEDIGTTSKPKKKKKKPSSSKENLEGGGGGGGGGIEEDEAEAPPPVSSSSNRPKPKKKKPTASPSVNSNTRSANNNNNNNNINSNPRRATNQAGAIVAYDEEANRQGPPPSSRRGRPKPRQPPPPIDDHDHDDFSAISDGEYADDDDYDPLDEPQFKYSTAELPDSTCRNTRCYLIAAGIFCLILAIVLSIVMVRIFDDQDEENRAPRPTMAPTTAEEANQPGITLFQLPRETVEEDRCDQANSESCRNTCEGFDCCDPTFANDCFLYNPEGCLNYKRCHIPSGSGIQPPPFNFASLCSPSSIANNRQPCIDACSTVSCCWDDSTTTCYDQFYACLDYSLCQNLRETVNVPAATFEVERFCDSSQTGSLTQADACSDACRPAECCWEEDDSNLNCLETDFIACMSYYPCNELLPTLPAAGSVLTLPPASLSNDCSFALINSGNTAQCENACQNATCCLEDTSATSDCFAEDPLACLAYERCRVLDSVA